MEGDYNMDNIGLIGYGSMGSMLVRNLILDAGIGQSRLYVTRKNIDRLSEIKKAWPDINVTKEAVEVVKNAKYIFLCMKPMEYKDILKEISPMIGPEHHIITIAGALLMEDIATILSCKITRILPTVLSEIKEGITLICHNPIVGKEEAKELEEILSRFMILKPIPEEDFEFASEFTSCGPGFVAAIFKEFVEAGLRYSDQFTKEELADLVLRTAYGTTDFMLQKKLNFDDIILRVATKGGITEEGVKVISEGMPMVFDSMFERTMAKRETVATAMHQQYINP